MVRCHAGWTQSSNLYSSFCGLARSARGAAFSSVTERVVSRRRRLRLLVLASFMRGMCFSSLPVPFVVIMSGDVLNHYAAGRKITFHRHLTLPLPCPPAFVS